MPQYCNKWNWLSYLVKRYPILHIQCNPTFEEMHLLNETKRNLFKMFFDNYDMNSCKQVLTLMNSSVKILLREPCVLKLISERRNWVFVIYQNCNAFDDVYEASWNKSFWCSTLECYEKLFPFWKVHQVTTWTLINA